MSKARDLADSVAAGGVLADGAVSLSEITSASGVDLNFVDNSKAVFGAGSDLQIYHDGSNSYINEVGVGSLLVSATNLRLRDANANLYLLANSGAEVELYYNGSQKLATTATGIDVTGTVVADGLQIDASSTSGFKVTNEATSGVRLTAYQGTSNSNVRTAYVDAQELVVSTGSPTGTTVTEAMRITSAGSVGIGTSSPTQKLEVNVNGGNSATAYALIAAGGTNKANQKFGVAFDDPAVMSIFATYDGTATRRNEIVYSAPTHIFKAANNGSEYVRITSAGDLLVGTTSSNPISATDDGIAISGGGYILASRASNNSAAFDRRTTDGDIVKFYKDGTTVGSIGSRLGRAYLYSPYGTGAGLRFGDNIIQPSDSDGTDRNNATDLGSTSSRFKDLYLSGTATAGAFVGDGSGLSNLPGFPAGTAMLFVQTAAPTGWTKSTAHDNKALRLVSGAVGSGGSAAFTTAFGTPAVSGSVSLSGSVGATTLSVAQLASHNHSGTTRGGFNGSNSSYQYHASSATSTGSTGGNASHTHSFSGSGSLSSATAAINVAYVDAIIAVKD